MSKQTVKLTRNSRIGGKLRNAGELVEVTAEVAAELVAINAATEADAKTKAKKA